MNANDIVALRYKGYVTNKPEDLPKFFSPTGKPRKHTEFIKRSLAQTMFDILAIPQWEVFAKGPAIVAAPVATEKGAANDNARAPVAPRSKAG